MTQVWKKTTLFFLLLLLLLTHGESESRKQQGDYNNLNLKSVDDNHHDDPPKTVNKSDDDKENNNNPSICLPDSQGSIRDNCVDDSITQTFEPNPQTDIHNPNSNTNTNTNNNADKTLREEDSDPSSSSSSLIVQVSPSNWQQTMYGAPLVLLNVHSAECSVCTEFAPHYQEAHHRAIHLLHVKGVLFAGLSAEEQPQLLKSLRVHSYPTVLLFRHGVLAEEYEGPLDASHLITFLFRQQLEVVQEISQDDKSALNLFALQTTQFASRVAIVGVGGCSMEERDVNTLAYPALYLDNDNNDDDSRSSNNNHHHHHCSFPVHALVDYLAMKTEEEYMGFAWVKSNDAGSTPTPANTNPSLIITTCPPPLFQTCIFNHNSNNNSIPDCCLGRLPLLPLLSHLSSFSSAQTIKAKKRAGDTLGILPWVETWVHSKLTPDFGAMTPMNAVRYLHKDLPIGFVYLPLPPPFRSCVNLGVPEPWDCVAQMEAYVAANFPDYMRTFTALAQHQQQQQIEHDHERTDEKEVDGDNEFELKTPRVVLAWVPSSEHPDPDRRNLVSFDITDYDRQARFRYRNNETNHDNDDDDVDHKSAQHMGFDLLSLSAFVNDVLEGRRTPDVQFEEEPLSWIESIKELARLYGDPLVHPVLLCTAGLLVIILVWRSQESSPQVQQHAHASATGCADGCTHEPKVPEKIGMGGLMGWGMGKRASLLCAGLAVISAVNPDALQPPRHFDETLVMWVGGLVFAFCWLTGKGKEPTQMLLPLVPMVWSRLVGGGSCCAGGCCGCH